MSWWSSLAACFGFLPEKLIVFTQHSVVETFCQPILFLLFMLLLLSFYSREHARMEIIVATPTLLRRHMRIKCKIYDLIYMFYILFPGLLIAECKLNKNGDKYKDC